MINKMFTIIKAYSKKYFTPEEHKILQCFLKRDINTLTIICLTLTIILLLNLIIFFNMDRIQSLKRSFYQEKITQKYNDNI